MLFDTDIERTRMDGKRQDEDDLVYLNVSNRPEAQAVREFLEACLQGYPAEHRDEMIQRLRGSDVQYASATFELFLHACFTRLGWAVEIHPVVPNGNGRHPDFRVETLEGEAFYVEATIARQFSAAELAAERRKNEVLRAIDDMQSPDFMVEVDVEGTPRTNVPRRNLRHRLRTWLATLDFDEVDSRLKSGQPRPMMTYEHDGWTIRFKGIARRQTGGKSRRTIALFSPGVRSISIQDALRSAARSKATRYGELDLPLMVAINIEEEFDDMSQERDALFGTLQFWIPRDPAQDGPEVARLPDGVWMSRSGPVCTRLSAVWVVRRFDPWHFVSRGSNVIYVNPWAAASLPNNVLRFPYAVEVQGALQNREGVSFQNLFSLHAEWPGPARTANA
jgi:hypothetical protein